MLKAYSTCIFTLMHIYMILQINIRENVIFTINMYNAGRQAGRYVSHQGKQISLICPQCWLESKFSHPLSDFTKCISRHVSKIQDYWSQLLFLGSHLILTKNNLDDTCTAGEGKRLRTTDQSKDLILSNFIITQTDTCESSLNMDAALRGFFLVLPGSIWVIWLTTS